jgi:DNA processing protein
VLVIEAGLKSGTLITARLASEYNRDLLCVPHRIGDPHGFGAHLFLRLGAAHITESAHILEALHIEQREDQGRLELAASLIENLNTVERKVYELLEIPFMRDHLLRISNLPAHQALTTLISLELKGIIKEEFGTWRRV